MAPSVTHLFFPWTPMSDDCESENFPDITDYQTTVQPRRAAETAQTDAHGCSTHGSRRAPQLAPRRHRALLEKAPRWRRAVRRPPPSAPTDAFSVLSCRPSQAPFD